MKKLMIAAALAAVTTGAFAAGCTIGGVSGCSVEGTVKFSGKTGAQVYDKKLTDKEYAAVQKISGKGVLTLDDTDYVEEFSSLKVGKVKLDDADFALVGGEVLQWTYFGKDLENATGNGPKSKGGKSFTLESDLGLSFTDYTIDDDYQDLLSAVDIRQVAFGKVKAKLSKEGEVVSGCEITPVKGCVPSITLKSYSGWFAGWFEPLCADVDDDPFTDCIPFEDTGKALVGGTWSVKF